MKYKVLVSRICYQQEWFEIDVPLGNLIANAAIEIAGQFDWGDSPTTDVEFDVFEWKVVPPPIERKVTVIFGEMSFEDGTCLVIDEEDRLSLPISKAEEIAEDLVSKGLYISYVIPELYSGTIL